MTCHKVSATGGRRGAEDIDRANKKFNGFNNGPQKIFVDFEWAMKCVSE